MQESLKVFLFISIIFFTGFILRADTVNLHHFNASEKDYLTDFQGLPYMYDADCYYNYRVTLNYFKNGHLGDKYNGKFSWNIYSYYPEGRPANYPPFIAWLAVFFYNFLALFVNITLYEACFWLPAIIAPFTGIMLFLLMRNHVDDISAFIAGILVVTTPIYFSRTVAGFFDTDMLNVLIPLIIVLFFHGGIRTENLFKKYIKCILAAVFLLLFSLTWNGWAFIFIIIVLTSLIYVIVLKGSDKSSTPFIQFFAVFILFSILFIGMLKLFGAGIYLNFPNTSLFLKSNFNNNWPNANLSVSELSKPSFIEFVWFLGGLNIGFGILGVVVVVLNLLSANLKDKSDLFFYLLMSVWLFVGLISYSMSIRFGIISFIPLVAFSSISINKIIGTVFKLKNNFIRIFILFLIISSLFVISVAQTQVFKLRPAVNDDFVDAAAFINKTFSSPPVLVMDWSYGHYFTSEGIPVLMDGGCLTPQRNYWISRALSTDNETLSKNILIMLSCSGDIPIEMLYKRTGNISLTATILNEILSMDKKDAKSILMEKYGMNPNFSNQLLNFTHPYPKKRIVILTGDHEIKSGYWNFYYGYWNFAKSQPQEFVYSEGEITSINDTLKHYSNNMSLDLKKRFASWNGKRPYEVILVYKNHKDEFRVYNESNLVFIVFMEKNRALVVDKKSKNSLFIKISVLNEGTEHFKRIYANGHVSLWELR